MLENSGQQVNAGRRTVQLDEENTIKYLPMKCSHTHAQPVLHLHPVLQMMWCVTAVINKNSRESLIVFIFAFLIIF